MGDATQCHVLEGVVHRLTEDVGGEDLPRPPMAEIVDATLASSGAVAQDAAVDMRDQCVCAEGQALQRVGDEALQAASGRGVELLVILDEEQEVDVGGERAREELHTWAAIERKEVDVDARVGRLPCAADAGAGVDHLQIVDLVGRVVVGVEPVGRAAESVVEQLAEAVEMVARDTEIHIVVPGNEAAVTDGAEHGTAQHVVGGGVLSADAIEDGGHVEQ